MCRSAGGQLGEGRLKENIEHHIEEEEGEMFRAARGILSRDELRDLARQMVALKRPSGRRRPKGV